MFSRKPKNIVSKVIDLTTGMDAKEASHTWMSADKTRQVKFGSTSRETFEERRQIDRDRKSVARYNDSHIASVATIVRGDITRAASLERSKIRKRFSADKPDSTQVSQPIAPTPPQDGPSFYPDFRPKL